MLCQSTYSPKFDENPPVPFWVILLTNRDSGRNITPFTPTCPFTSKLSRPALSRLWRRLPFARGYDVATNAPAPCCRSWVAHVAKRHQVSIDKLPANTGVQSESKIKFWGKIFSTAMNFKIKFYAVIRDSYLQRTTGFTSIISKFDKVVWHPVFFSILLEKEKKNRDVTATV